MALPHRGRRRFAPTGIFPMLQTFCLKLRLLKKVYPFIKIHKDDSAKMFKKILLMLSVVNCFHKNKKLSMRSGRAGPPFSVRPEKEAKGAAATVATVACARHIGSRKRWCTLEPVRRTFPNSTPHGVSNTWKGSFLPSGQKSSHEPRRQMLQMLPWPSASVLRCI